MRSEESVRSPAPYEPPGCRYGEIDTTSGRFAFLAAGPPRGRLVLCLHGFPDQPESFGMLLVRLGAAGYRAVAPWMRGYAPSVLTGPYHADQLADDVLALADALAGDERVAVAGHDWGAVAAWTAGARAPERLACAVTMAVPHPLAFLGHLVRRPSQLRRSWYMLLMQVPGVAERALARDDFALVDRLWRAWSPGFALDDAARRRLCDCLAASLPAPIEYYRALARPLGPALARVRRAARADARVAAPTLHLHGVNDGCSEAASGARQRRYMAGPFESELIGGAGHFLHLERPDEVGRRIIRWLRMYYPSLARSSRR